MAKMFTLLSALLVLVAINSRPTEATQNCGQHARVVQCGTTCPLSCDNLRNPPKVCTLACFNGCRCESGYIFKTGDSGDCIRARECARK